MDTSSDLSRARDVAGVYAETPNVGTARLQAATFDPPTARFTAGITFSAISSIERRASRESAQSMPQYSSVPKSPVVSRKASRSSATLSGVPAITNESTTVSSVTCASGVSFEGLKRLIRPARTSLKKSCL